MKLKRGRLLPLISLLIIIPVTAAEAASNIYENYKQVKTNEIQITKTEFQKTEISKYETRLNLATRNSSIPIEAEIVEPVLTIEEYRQLYGPCGEYHDLAISVGWSEEQWKRLSKIMFRESRCGTLAHNTTDPTKAGSRGLIQINGFWCLPSRYNPDGFLQKVGALGSCDDLWIPEVNLRAGLAIFRYSEEVNGDGWQPWRT